MIKKNSILIRLHCRSYDRVSVGRAMIMLRIDRQVDIAVGRKIKELRLARGLSQTILADALGVTYQQFAKYERGMNRVSAAQIHIISQILDFPIANFFENLPTGQTGSSSNTHGFDQLKHL